MNGSGRRGGLLIAALGVLLGVGAAHAGSSGSRWPGDGHARDLLQEKDATPVGGVSFGPGVVGQGFHFNGVDGALRLPDAECFRFTRSLTISAWVKVLSYPSPGQGIAQILFRGDDRGGLDPYFLAVEEDGMLVFGVDSGSGATYLRVPIPLHRFTHVTASLDDASGKMRILFNGHLVADATTPHRPFRDLDSSARPGLGIGNHGSRPDNTWNQPFHGVIVEVTLSGEAEGATDTETKVVAD